MSTVELKALRAFTLIELLVVMAIIGLLSSVVLASLNTARGKGTDAAIQEEVGQLRTLIELDASENAGSYANTQYDAWISYSTTCSIFTAGNYASREQQLCQALLKNAGSCNFASYQGLCVLIGNAQLPSGTFIPTKYSINVYLPGMSARTGVATWFCAGSSGATSYMTTSGFTDPGCYYNP
ncbi:MAG: type II secretion system protein [Patescibacteria group bacterium]|nr:type II secretion system protein [Patescibacteria group bacterium]